jgi:hypothetical protein
MHQETDHQAMKSTAADRTELATKRADKISSQIPAPPLLQRGLPSRAWMHAPVFPLGEDSPSRHVPARKPPHQRTVKLRKDQLRAAAEHAGLIGYTLNSFLTITWKTLGDEDGCDGKTWQRKSQKARDRYLLTELARFFKRAGVPWLAIYARAISTTVRVNGHVVGAHTHVFMHCPPHMLDDLIAFIESLTGANADMTVGKTSRSARTVARSGGGGWQLDRNTGGVAGMRALTEYILSQHDKPGHAAAQDIDGKPVGATEAIGPKARKKYAAAQAR